MTIKVDSGKAKITLADTAKAKPDVLISKTFGTNFACSHLTNGFVPGITLANVSATDAFTATATVPVDVPAADLATLKLWNFGFIQFQRIGALTLYYSGQYSERGEIIVQANLAPAMGNSHGRDHSYDPNPPWLRVGTSGDLVFNAATGLVTVKTGDHPMCRVGTEIKNTKTGYTNYLRRLIDARTFHTIFAALDPNGKYHHLAHFKWTVNWDFEFQWSGGSMIGKSKAAGAGQTGFTADAPQSGAPADSKVLAMLKDPKMAAKLGTNEQSAALKNAINGPPNLIESSTYNGFVPANFWK